MDADPAALPDDIEALKAALLAERRAGGCGADRSRRRAGRAIRRPGADRPSEAADREAQARDLRPALGAQRAAARSDGIATGGAGGVGDRGRTRGREGRGQDHESSPRSAASGRRASRSPSTCRASGWSCRPDGLRLLRRRAAVQAGRGCHRDAGGHSAAVEGDPARPREVHLPRLRDASARRRRRSMSLPAAGRARACWRCWCSKSSDSISR